MSTKVIGTPIVKTSANLSRNMEVQSLEKNIENIIPGSLPYFQSIFKQMLWANQQNADTLYTFLFREHNERNVKLGTKITYIKSFTFLISS